MKRRIGREWTVVLLGSLFYAVMYSVGSLIYEKDMCDPFKVFCRVVYVFPVFIVGLRFFFKRRCLSKRIHRADDKPFSAVTTFLIILGCFALFYVIVYPGSFTYDTHDQLEQVKSGRFSAHHPLLHTLLIKLCIDMLPVLGSYQNCATAYAVIQMIAMAAIFALSCASIQRFSGNGYARIACLFYSLYPMHMCFSSHMTKDPLFAATFSLAFTLMIEVVVRKQMSRWTMLGIVCFGMLAIALRNNMLYAAAVWLLLALFFLRKDYGKKLAACMLLAVVLGVGMNSALMKALDAEPGSKREMLSWPLQQIARARVYTGERFSEREKELFDALIRDEHYVHYESYCSDRVKNWMEMEVLENNLEEYVSLYVSIGKKCPQQYIDAIAALIYPYIYPYPEYKIGRDYIEMGIDQIGFDMFYGKGSVKASPTFEKVRQWMRRNIWKTGANHIPVLRWFFNLGLICWVMLYLVIREAYDGNWPRFMVGLLLVLLWGTHLLGPIMNGRYAYAFVCTLPALWSGTRNKEGESNETR